MSCVVLISEHVINERTSFRSQRFFCAFECCIFVRMANASESALRGTQASCLRWWFAHPPDASQAGSLRTPLSSLTIDQSSITLTHNLLHDILSYGHGVAVELHTDFHYFLAIGIVGQGVVVAVDLVEGLLGGTVDLEFEDINRFMQLYHKVTATSFISTARVLSSVPTSRKWILGTEVSEVKMEVKMGVNSLRSWKLKRTLHCWWYSIFHNDAESKTIVHFNFLFISLFNFLFYFILQLEKV